MENNISPRKQRYDSILSYLESTDEFMYKVIDLLGLSRLFKARSKIGIVFLNPQSTEWREKVQSYIDAEDVDKLNDISESLASCVLYDNLRNFNDFKNHADDIPNANGRVLSLDLDKSRGSSLKIISAGTIVADPNFIDGSKTQIYSVYKLNGDLPPCNTPETQNKYTKITNGRKKSDKEAELQQQKIKDMEQELIIRSDLVNEIVHNYWQNLRNAKKLGKPMTLSPYVESVLSLYYYIRNYADESEIKDILYARILPIISFTVLDVFLIFEPYKQSSDTTPFLLNGPLLRQWIEWRERSTYNINTAFDILLNDIKQNNETMRTQDLLEYIDDRRNNIASLPTSSRFIDEIYKMYDSVCASNTLNKLPVFTNYWHNIYKNNPTRKMAEDELRFDVFFRCMSLENSYNDVPIIAYKSIINDISRVLSSNWSREKLNLLNKPALANDLTQKQRYKNINMFLHSMFFMYQVVGNTPEESFPFDISASPESQKEGKIYNPFSNLITNHRARINIHNIKYDQRQIAELLNTIAENPDNVDPDIRSILDKIKNGNTQNVMNTSPKK